MLRRSALTAGVVLSLIGATSIAVYMIGVVDIVIHDHPDRSWLFWGLGIFGFGVMALGSGIVLLVVGAKQRQADRLDHGSDDQDHRPRRGEDQHRD